MMIFRKALCAAAFFVASAQALAAPQVVASIVPVHALVAGVMDGVGRPVLLLKGAASPHDYALRPSDAAALQRADTVFWIGSPLEGFMQKTLAANRVRHVMLIDATRIRYEPREGGIWETGRHEGHAHAHDGHEIDPHVWLDPRNAITMVDAITRELSALDADNKARYEANAKSLNEKLAVLDDELAQMLAPIRAVPFIVFHDAYQYFEKRYGLNGVGSITVNPEQKPSAKRLQALRSKIQKSGVTCVFAEPQFNDALIRSLTEGLEGKRHVKRGTLDPLGVAASSHQTSDVNAYFTMMRALAQEVRHCLEGA